MQTSPKSQLSHFQIAVAEISQKTDTFLQNEDESDEKQGFFLICELVLTSWLRRVLKMFHFGDISVNSLDVSDESEEFVLL